MTQSDKKEGLENKEDETMDLGFSGYNAFFLALVGFDPLTRSEGEELAAGAGSEVLDRRLALRVLIERLRAVDEKYPELGVGEELRAIVERMASDGDTSVLEDDTLRELVTKVKPQLKELRKVA